MQNRAQSLNLAASACVEHGVGPADISDIAPQVAQPHTRGKGGAHNHPAPWLRRLATCAATLLSATVLPLTIISAATAHPQSGVPTAGAAFVAAASLAQPQQAAPPTDFGPPAIPPVWTHVVVPQHRVVPVRPGVAQGVQLSEVNAKVAIHDRIAETRLDLTVVNPSAQQAEAVLLVPVPAGAAVKGFSYSNPPGQPVSQSEGVAQVLPRDEARRLYDSIVRAARDPGLLEFAGATLLRSSVFPIAPGASQRVRVEWEQVVASEDGRLDYALPRGESLRYETPWTLQLSVTQAAPIAAVYSPSHGLVEVHRGSGPNQRHFTLDTLSQRAPGPFLVSVLPSSAQGGAAAASVAAYPDPSISGGYFMLLGGIADQDSAVIRSAQPAAATLQREVTIVLDRSGSMAGGKLDQAKAAAMQVIEGLGDAERFNVIDYSNGVSAFAPAPVMRTSETVAAARNYLAALRPSGGTNISDALTEALRQPGAPGYVGLVLFLTDGLPTVGQTSERAIRDIVERGNAQHRRIYTIGVGADVNVPLLDRVADLTRAKTTYILPDESVEVKVASVARQLRGPMLADIALTARDSSGAEDTKRVRDLAPTRIPDLFEGEELVVFGSYLGEQPTALALSGRAASGPVSTSVPFDPAIATTRHAYVARLWATRRIAELVDHVRQLASESPGLPIGAQPPMNDPRVKELVDEIVKLSARFGILTEYTAFFANEGTNLGDLECLEAGCTDLLARRAVATRTGTAAVSQGINWNEAKGKAQLAYDNRFIDETLREQRVLGLQQVNDRCFYNNAGRWVQSDFVGGAFGGGGGALGGAGAHGADGAAAASTTANAPDTVSIDETVEFGSDRHLALVAEFAEEGRQGSLSLPGDTLVRHRGRTILVRNPTTPTL